MSENVSSAHSIKSAEETEGPDAQTAPSAAAKQKRGLRAISLPGWIGLGALAGIVAGLLFGERMSIVAPLGSAYAMMLQIAVYPYLLCSLLYGLGQLTPERAKRLFRASWGTYLFMWVVTLASIWILARAIPPTPLPSVLTADSQRTEVEFFNLLIPANLFEALGRNYVPAVVVFAIIYGIAIQKIERKSALFEVLQVVQGASITIWKWVVLFAPIGVFALFANMAGTIELARISGLALYVGLSLIGGLFIAFVILPAALAAIAPVSQREILRELRPAFVLAAVTTLSVAALPFVQQAAERITARAGCPDNEERADLIKATLSLSYVLAQLGNYFTYLLMFYASYHYQVRYTPAEQLLLPFWTVLSGLGSPTATVDGVVFVGQWLRLPSSILDLFLATWTVTRYPQVILSVMGFGFANILIPLIYFGKIELRPRRVVSAAALYVILFGAVVAVGTALRPQLLPRAEDPLMAKTLDPRLVHNVEVKVYHDGKDTEALPASTDRYPALAAIQSSGVLRVGYNPNVIPFCYWNENGDLVGFDVAFAYRLASDLHVRLELIPYEWQNFTQELINRRFDLAIGGLYQTADRVFALTVSDSYYQSPVALIVRSTRAKQFLSRGKITAMSPLRIAVLDNPVLVPMTHYVFPNATLRVVANYDVLPEIADEIDGAIWSLQQAGSWARVHPGFTAVAPADMGGPVMLAYLMGPGDIALGRYVDQWLALKAASGFKAEQLDYWINGNPRPDPRPRWNLLDAVLQAWRGPLRADEAIE